MYPFPVLSGLMGGYVFPDNILQFHSVNNSRGLILKNGDLYVQGNTTGGATGQGGPIGYRDEWTNMLSNCRLMANYIYGMAVLTNDGKFITTGYANYIGGLLSYSFVDRTNYVFPAGGPLVAADIKDFVIGSNAMFILMKNGDLYGMGDNNFRELGRSGAVTTPTLLATNVKKAAVEYRIGAYMTNDGKFFASGDYAGDLGFATRSLSSFTELKDADQDGRDTYFRDFSLFAVTSAQSVVAAYSLSPTATGPSMVYGSRGFMSEDTRPARPNINLCRRVNSMAGSVIQLPARTSSSYDLQAVIDGVRMEKGRNPDGELGRGDRVAVNTAVPTKLPSGIDPADITFDTIDDAGSSNRVVGNTRYMIVKGAMLCSGAITNIDKNRPATTNFTQILNMPQVKG